jgi:hypothetical protein
MLEQTAHDESQASQEYVEPGLEVQAGFDAAENSGDTDYSTAMPVCPANC